MRVRRRRPVYADREVVELFAEEPELLAVVDALSATGRRQVRRGTLAGGAGIAVVVSVAILILAPWRGSDHGIIDSALGAVGTRPVIHSLVSGYLLNDMRVSVASGRSSRVHVSVETWFDSERGVVRTVIRHEGIVVSDTRAPTPIRSVPGLATLETESFTTGYRAALRAGDARVTHRGRFHEQPAIWLEIRRGGMHEQVVLDARSSRPVAFQMVGARNRWLVERLRSEARAVRDFRPKTSPAPANGHVTAEYPADPATVSRSAGFRPLWAGERIAGFRLKGAAVQTLVQTRLSVTRRLRGVLVRYRRPHELLLEIRTARVPAVAYGFTGGRFTVNLNPVVVGVLDVARVGSEWIGQTRLGALYVSISSTNRSAVLMAAKNLRLLR